ncbi:META domain-containing protein [Streptomyces sp. NPDC057638]|uniref:META domain-containing protein n=1 Tax=Streptomyces sp. NPDC057638 TaxID=3346190 RepID=UPI00367C9259
MRTRLSIPVTVLALLALAACGDEKSTGAGSGGGAAAKVATDLPLTGARWGVDSVTVGGKTTAGTGAAHIELTAKGRAQGSFGCNQFGAAADLAGSTLTVTGGDRTEMACTDPGTQRLEDALAATFQGRLSARLDGEKLTLTSAKGDTIALSAQQKAPLTTTTWMVSSMMERDLLVPLPAGTENRAKLTFGADGTVRGNLGCNTFSGTATISGETITFGALATSRRLCAGTAGQLEAHLIKVLKGKATFAVKHHALSITGPDGQGLSATATP